MLNTRQRDVHRDLDNANKMHQRVMSLLPDDLGDSARAQTNTLYRLESTHAGARLLVQTSSNMITFDRLPDAYAISTATVDLTPLLNRLTTSIPIRYAITTNPIKTVGGRKETGLRGKRVPLTDLDDIYTWWQRRAAEAGLDILNHPTAIDIEHSITGGRGNSAAAGIRHHAVTIEGTATITDPELTRQAIVTGIGRGKPYGLGLLTAVPIENEARTA
ncbi:type I-E CRISPR-associated protein Cas6/Cse3/CasE [Actinoplanes sp. NPDC049598]|uniref:type I-E CRISPR-associated protein Cas6/Cse3/CasE n=1 Tax=Actinoplanes sp. NPDC049598 TaxID=3154626 RepID=UPI00342CA812